MLFKALVGLDDALHQLMAHHILMRKMTNGNILYALQYVYGALKPAHLSRRQVYLR